MGVSHTLVLVLIFLTGVYTQNRYKICASSKDRQDCEQLSRKEFIECIQHVHHIDCLLDIEHNKVDIGRVTAEEALIAAKFVKNVVVLGEFRNDAIYDDSELGTVVVVRRNHTEGLKNFRGKKYCHPGFKFNKISTDYMLKEFENAVLKENNIDGCQNSGPLVEKELKTLNDFFGPSCRPGPWIGFEQYDTSYIKKYSNLCELCSNKDKCVAGNTPFNDSLSCLFSGGDVAVSTIKTVEEYFNQTQNQNKRDEYRYLCKNGNLNTLDNACTWSKQPWNLIVINKERNSIKSELESWFYSYLIDQDSNVQPFSDQFVISNMKPVLFPSETEDYKIKFVSGSPSLEDYLKNYRDIPTLNEKCNENIRWCTISDAEQQNCEWLAQASTNIGIQPVIKCVKSLSKFDCLEDIKINKADVVTSDAHYGYIARRKNLAPLAFPDTAEPHRIKPIIVIRNNNSNITQLSDLKNKKACLPEYGGIEWLSFITTAREQGVISKSNCDYGELISSFVSDSCMPGAHDQIHEVTKNINQDKLCKLCQPDPYKSKTTANCNSDETNRFYGNSGALQCLKDVGEFAVVTKEAYSEFYPNEFRVLCRNGSLALTSGFNVDDNCALTKITDSEVLSKKDSTKISDIRILLLNLETRFGLDRHKPFEVFNAFNQTLDLLFNDTTQGLSPLDSEKEHIKNFVNLFSSTEKCVETNDQGGGAKGVEISVLCLITTFLFVFTLRRNN